MREIPDFRTTNEEADVIIIQQVIHLANSDKTSIRVIADDKDVFAILLRFYNMKHLICNWLMIGTSSRSKCVDINAQMKEINT